MIAKSMVQGSMSRLQYDDNIFCEYDFGCWCFLISKHNLLTMIMLCFSMSRESWTGVDWRRWRLHMDPVNSSFAYWPPWYDHIGPLTRKNGQRFILLEWSNSARKMVKRKLTHLPSFCKLVLSVQKSFSRSERPADLQLGVQRLKAAQTPSIAKQ